MNWKMVIDTFLEPYHFPVLHPGDGPSAVLSQSQPVRSVRPTPAGNLSPPTITELRACPESDWDLITHTAVIYVLFPSTVIVMQGDHAELWRIFPDANRTDASIIHLDFYIPEPAETDSARRHWDRNLDLVLRTVEEEDFPIGEGIQRGFLANPQAEVVYGRNEPALQHCSAQWPRRSRMAPMRHDSVPLLREFHDGTQAPESTPAAGLPHSIGVAPAVDERCSPRPSS